MSEYSDLADKIQSAKDFTGFEWKSFAATNEPVEISDKEKEMIVAALRDHAPQAWPPIETEPCVEVDETAPVISIVWRDAHRSFDIALSAGKLIGIISTVEPPRSKVAWVVEMPAGMVTISPEAFTRSAATTVEAAADKPGPRGWPYSTANARTNNIIWRLCQGVAPQVVYDALDADGLMIVEKPERSTASTDEAVAIHPVEMDSQQIAQALDNYRRWTVLEPETHDLLNAAAQRLRAIPPSSGNADAVRQELHGKMNCLVGIALSSTNGFTYLNDHARKLLNQAAAALSSAPVAGEIELKVEQGGAGLWYATSDQIPGLLVAEQTHGLALNKVGHMLWNMQKARLLSRHDRSAAEVKS